MKKLLTKLLSILMVVTCISFNAGVSVYAESAANWNRLYGDSTAITLDNNSLSEEDAVSFINSKFQGNNQCDGYYVIYAKSSDKYSVLEISYNTSTNKYTKKNGGEVTYDNLKSAPQTSHVYVIGTVTSDHTLGMIEPQGFTITRYDTYYKISGLTIPSGKYLVVAAVKNNTISTMFGGDVSKCYQQSLSIYDVVLHNYQKSSSVGFGTNNFECHILSSVEDKIEFSNDCNPDAGIYVSIADSLDVDTYPAYTLGMTTNPTKVGTSSNNKLQPELTGSSSTPTAVSTVYVNAAGVTQAAVDCTPIATSTASLGTDGNTTWYVANDTVEVDSLTVNGDVNLILADDKTLTVTNSINSSTSNSSLTVYGQSGQTGSLIAKSINISGGSNTFAINGGTIKVNNDTTSGGAYGIWVNGCININGGIIESTGSTSSNYNGYGIFANNNITINGGKVTANGSSNTNEGYGIVAIYNITINGGNVETNGSSNTNYGYGILAKDGDITISGNSTVTASGSSKTNNGYGIVAANGSIAIGGNSTVTANGSSEGDVQNFAYGILAKNGDITISGNCTVTANGSTTYISYGIFTMGSLEISDSSTVTANGLSSTNEGYGIVAGNGSIAIGGNSIVTANGSSVSGTYSQGTGIFSSNSSITINGNSTVIASGSGSGAGTENCMNAGIIGAGITISENSTVTASTSGTNKSFGILSYITLTISGGTTKAKGSTVAVFAVSPLSIDDSMTTKNAKYGTFDDSTMSFVEDGTSYVPGTTTALANADTGYVTISSSTPTTPTGGSGGSGYTAPKTGVEGVSANNSISKVVGLLSLVTLAGYVVIKKKEN